MAHNCLSTPAVTLSCLLLLIWTTACKPEGSKRFRLVSSDESGILFANTIWESEEFNVLKYGYYYNGGGVAAADFDNDGWTDIFFTGNLVGNKLYRNKGAGRLSFEDVTRGAGIASEEGWNSGVSVVDINDDGWMDIYVCRTAAQSPRLRKNLLFLNNGDLTFTEAASHYGLDDAGYSTQAVFFDYDKDGDLDCFILNHSVQEYAGFGVVLSSNKTKTNPYLGSKLLVNEGGNFVDQTRESGIISNVLNFGLGVSVSDLNDDGWLDLYITNDYNEEDYLYINRKDGSFKEIGKSVLDHMSLFSMGCDVADINQDGQMDILTLDMLPATNERIKMTSGDDNFLKHQTLEKNGFHKQYMRNMLHLGSGIQSSIGDITIPQYTELGQYYGISNTDWSWSALWADLDLDGWLDLYITNGYAKDYTNMEFLNYLSSNAQNRTSGSDRINQLDIINKMPAIRESNYAFRNTRGLNFEDATASWGLSFPSISHGCVLVDLDNDGDLDILTNDINANPLLFENRTSAKDKDSKNFIGINPVSIGGASLIGARIKLYSKTSIQTLEYIPVRGYQSCTYDKLSFGLQHDCTEIDSIVIHWQDNKATTITNPEKNVYLSISESDRKEVKIGTNPHLKNIVDMDSIYFHVEDVQNDFEYQALLPFMRSYQGPTLSSSSSPADYLYIGGTPSKPGTVFHLVHQDIKHIAMPQEALMLDATASCWIDVDGDGREELIVGYSVYHEDKGPGKAIQIFALANDRCTLVQSVLDLDINVSALVPIDYNQDGAMDLFVGGGTKPLSYPHAHPSYLLINDGTGSLSLSKDLPHEKLGIVSDALTTDWNEDGLPDLIVAQEWGPIAILYNQGAHFHGSTPQPMTATGLWHAIGLWSSSLPGNKKQLICGNLGVNNQLAYISDSTLELYADHFFESDKLVPILTFYQDGTSYPFAARDELISSLPELKKKYTNYVDYSTASVEEVLGGRLDRASHYTARELRSGIISSPTSTYVPLPSPAQWSSVHAILVTDLNNDHLPDLLLGGNLSHTRIRIGQMKGNDVQLFLADADGRYSYAGALHIQGDVRALVEHANHVVVGINDGPTIMINKEQIIQVIKNAHTGPLSPMQ